MGQDPSLAKWCVDSAEWKGPYGDKCAAYRVGGDRNFWSVCEHTLTRIRKIETQPGTRNQKPETRMPLSCDTRTRTHARIRTHAHTHTHRCEWDGADAPSACPFSCDSCTLKMKAHFLAARTLAHSHTTDAASQAAAQQQPATPPTPPPAELAGSAAAPTPGAVAAAAAAAAAGGDAAVERKGAAQMLAQETAAAKVSRSALVQEVAQLKQRLTAIAKATGYNMQHPGGGSGGVGGGGGNDGLSGKAAANDLHEFYSKIGAREGSSEVKS